MLAGRNTGAKFPSNWLVGRRTAYQATPSGREQKSRGKLKYTEGKLVSGELVAQIACTLCAEWVAVGAFLCIGRLGAQAAVLASQACTVVCNILPYGLVTWVNLLLALGAQIVYLSRGLCCRFLSLGCSGRGSCRANDRRLSGVRLATPLVLVELLLGKIMTNPAQVAVKLAIVHVAVGNSASAAHATTHAVLMVNLTVVACALSRIALLGALVARVRNSQSAGTSAGAGTVSACRNLFVAESTLLPANVAV